MIDASNQEGRQASLQAQYDFIVVGAGAAGSVLAAELSASGAQVLVIESGGPDDAPTIANPSVWFYNVGGPLDYDLPVNPSPRLNNRQFNMALGHVAWRRQQHQRHGLDARHATGLRRVGGEWRQGLGLRRRASGLQELKKTGRAAPMPGAAPAARCTSAAQKILIPQRQPSSTQPAQMGMPILDDVNGPMLPGAGYINMNIAADGTRVSAARAFLRPALSRPNLTLLLKTDVVKLNFKGTRCVGVKINDRRRASRTSRPTRK